MSMVAHPAVAPNVPHTHKLTVDEFLILNDNGVFEGLSKSELIDGEIVCLNSQFSRHARIKSLLLTEFNIALRAIGSDLQAWAEASVRLSDHSMPEPDIVLTRYRGSGPVPLETVALLVEVADTTLAIDLGRKADLYAAAGVAEYWVVDVEENRTLCHASPGIDGYGAQIDVPFGEPLSAHTIDELEVPTKGLD